MAEPPQLILLKGPLRQIPVDALALTVVEGEGKQGLIQHQSQGLGGKADGLLVLGEWHIQRRDALPLPLEQTVQPILPGGGHQGVALFPEAAVKGDPDADNVVAHEHQHHIGAVTVDDVAVAGLFQRLEFFQNHSRLPHIPIRSKSSKDTVRVMSLRGLGYFISTAFLLWL